VQVRLVLLPRAKREDLERQITALAVAGGELPAADGYVRRVKLAYSALSVM
jgi:hypothetical protein